MGAALLISLHVCDERAAGCEEKKARRVKTRSWLLGQKKVVTHYRT